MFEATKNNILSFIGEKSLNDIQKNTVESRFQKIRSDLYSYGALETSKNYIKNLVPAKFEAVKGNKDPLLPMMISIIPPDIYPSGQYSTRKIPAPAEVPFRVTKIGGGMGKNPLYGAINKDPDVGPYDNLIETQVSIRDMSGPTELDCIDSLKDRFVTFQKNVGKAEKDLLRKTTEIVKGRNEVFDVFAEESPEIRLSREYLTDEEFIRNQVLDMANLPPLFMYVNPSEFSISYEQIISEGDRSREGFIIEHWGLQMPRLSFSGNIGATLINAFDRNGLTSGGLTRLHRESSASYQSFMSLMQIYQNNAYIYNLDSSISILGSVKLFYDDTIYTGSFDSFSVSENESNPYDLKYSCQFTVRFMERISSSE